MLSSCQKTANSRSNASFDYEINYFSSTKKHAPATPSSSRSSGDKATLKLNKKSNDSSSLNVNKSGQKTSSSSSILKLNQLSCIRANYTKD